jgi:sodium transport system permease protein
VLTIMKKELLETLRDPLVLTMSLGFPMVFFPLIIWGTTQLAMLSAGLDDQAPPRIVILGTVAPGPGGVVDALRADPAIEGHGDEVDVQAGDLDLIATVDLQGPALTISLLHNSTLPRSRRAREWAEDQLEQVRTAREAELARAAGIAPESLAVWEIHSKDIARSRDRMISIMSQSMPLILVMMLLIATVSPAVDIFVGERERGTLETSLVTARSRWPLVLGKVLAASIIGVIGVTGNLVAGGITFAHTLATMGITDGGGLQLVPSAMALVVLPVASGALLIAGLTFLVIVPARTFKQAQSLSSWVIIGSIAVLYTGTGQDTAPALSDALFPGRNLMHCLSEALRGVLSLEFAVVSAGINLALAAVLLLAVHRIMNHEGYLFGPEDSGWRDAFASLLPWSSR